MRESTKLDEERAENFHSVVALLLFVSRRCRLDIQTALAFLTTRVSEPTLDDWNKLKRVLQYLRGTIDLKLTLGADDILKAKTWVDVSYGVHDDCRSHTFNGTKTLTCSFKLDYNLLLYNLFFYLTTTAEASRVI